MEAIIALILALISAMQAGHIEPIERPAFEERPAIAINPQATLPEGVDPATQAATIDPTTGEITNADGSTDCVTASPCDYARAGYAPGESAPGEIDPIWNSPELQGEAGR